MTFSQDQNEDTEWNDALRRHNIIPQKEKELTEEDIIDMVENTVQSKAEGQCFQCNFQFLIGSSVPNYGGFTF